jgi:hypothetical protein
LLLNDNQAIVSFLKNIDGSYSVLAGIFSFPSSLTPYGKTKTTSFLFQKDMVDEIYWNAIDTANYYKIYDSNFNLLYQGTDLRYYVHGEKESARKYYISWVGNSGESEKISLTIP